MTDYFGIDYPLEKMDLISIPKFGAMAMENWGLITFREEALLCNEATNEMDKLEIAIIVCHEIAHQWFGNLVTMEWWSDIWLNESFATWMSWETLHHLFPEWRVWEIYYERETLYALTVDALNGSHPITVEVEKPHDISSLFDGISYAKGSNVIRIIIKMIGEVEFRDGIRHYLKKYSYKNASTEGLWQCLEEISNKPVSKLIHSWVNQKNFPVITVKHHDDHHFEISQSCVNNQNHHWIVPLTDSILMHDKKIIIPKNNIADKINKNVWGFYRIHYDHHIILNIILKKFHELSNIDLASIISDTFELLKMQRLTIIQYEHRLILILNELMHRPLGSIYLVLNVIYQHYAYSKLFHKNEFKEIFIRIIPYPILQLEKHFKFDEKCDLSTLCGRNIFFQCLTEFFPDKMSSKCRDISNAVLSHIEKISSLEMITMVFTIKRHHEYFDELFKHIYKNPVLLEILGKTTDLKRYHQTLDLYKSNNVQIHQKIKIFMTASTNPELNQYYWDYVKNHWNDIRKIFHDDFMMLEKIVETLGFLRDSADIQEFFNDQPNLQKPVDKVVERIKRNMIELKK